MPGVEARRSTPTEFMNECGLQVKVEDIIAAPQVAICSISLEL